MKQLLISTFAAAVLLLFGAVNEVNGDPLKYEVVGDTVTIKDCKETASGAMAIPSIYEGKPVTSIGDWAFYGCTKLTSATIPDSVTGIGYAAFSKCGSLKSIDVGEGNTEYSSEDGVLFDKNKTVLIHFPAGKGGHYTIPDGVTSIGDHAFRPLGIHVLFALEFLPPTPQRLMASPLRQKIPPKPASLASKTRRRQSSLRRSFAQQHR